MIGAPYLWSVPKRCTTWADRYGAPVMLTETSVTGTVAERSRWLDASVGALHELKADGVDVVGYTWWPLFDMYEWTWRHTEAPRADHLLTMGLHDLVETPSGRLDRRRNPVADAFQRHATVARLEPVRVAASPAEVVA